jgi:hypothetical protein
MKMALLKYVKGIICFLLVVTIGMQGISAENEKKSILKKTIITIAALDLVSTLGYSNYSMYQDKWGGAYLVTAGYITWAMLPSPRREIKISNWILSAAVITSLAYTGSKLYSNDYESRKRAKICANGYFILIGCALLGATEKKAIFPEKKLSYNFEFISPNEIAISKKF